MSNEDFNTDDLQLIYAPHKSLGKKAAPALQNNISFRKAISYHMETLMQRHRGAGLAANQITLDAAVHVQMLQKEMVTMFNPQIHEISEHTVLMSEGCLSDPGMELKIKRPDMIKVSWEDVNDKRTSATLYGMDCRVFLHEFDHLQGVLFTDRVGKTKLAMARKKQEARFARAGARLIAANK